MSIKHVNKYYDQICDQYQEMLENLKDLSTEAEKGFVEPERVTRLEQQIAPIKQNYERWTYMMFLLRQPNRESKIPRYEQQNKKLLSSLSKDNSLSTVLRENNQVLTEMKS